MNYKQFFLLLFGSIIEWYDLTLCGIFALELSNSFLPASNLDPILIFYIIYGGAFIIRPVGATIIGLIGDNFGYNFGITLTIIISGISSLIIGVLPEFNSWGYWSTILFLLTRFLQNFCAASQLAGLISYAQHQDNMIRQYKKGFYASLAYSSSVLGGVVAILIASMSTYFLNNQLTWRIPFIISAFPLIVYYCLILSTTKNKPNPANPKISNLIQTLFKLQFKKIIIMSLLVFSSGALYNIFFVYFITFMIQQLHLVKLDSFLINLAILTLSIFLYPVFGILSDKMNRPIFLAKLALMALILAIVFLFCNLNNLLLLVLGLSLATIFFCAFVSPLLAILSVSFKYQYQMTASSMVIALGSVFAGFSLPIAHFVTTINNEKSLMYFAILLCLISWLGLNALKHKLNDK